MSVITTNSFSTDVIVPLNDASGALSSVFLERIAPLYDAAGSGSSWDAMLQFWVGGYAGPVPYINLFRLRGMAAGNYQLYLYSNKSGTGFYAAVNTDTPVAQTINPTFTTAFVVDRNYVVYDLTVPAGGYIYFKSVGYMSGMQLLRVS
jgi:hypothetical protein